MTATELLHLAWDHHRAGNLAGALSLYRQVLQTDANHADALHGAGLALMGQGRMDEAMPYLRRALEVRPGWPDAYNHLGISLGMTGRLGEAAENFRAAMQHGADDADVYNNLGSALIGLRRPGEAVPALREAVRRRPDFVEALASLGAALADQQQLDEAVSHLRRAIELRPDDADTHSNLAGCLTELGRLDDALAECELALRLEPGHVATHRLRSRIWLTQGDFERGWDEYEWRLHGPGAPSLAPPGGQPLWDGSDLAGRTILLRAEQGLGDVLQFARYAALVKGRGGRLVFESPAALVNLLSRCAGIDQLVPQGSELPTFDVYSPLASLPRMLGTRLDAVPAAVPYLFADAGRTAQWRDEIEALGGFRVGIAWQGSPQYRGDRRRSFPLRSLEPVAEVPGVRLVSLQKGAGREQLAEVAGRWPLTDLDDRLDAAGGFEDTAAIMQHLDLVISADTAVAHLAGGLGVPVWVALSFAPDFRWLAGRADSPWYPTMRLFRQPEPGNWGPVFMQIAAALRDRLGRS